MTRRFIIDDSNEQASKQSEELVDSTTYFDVVQATVSWDESGDLFAVLDQLDTNALADGRVRLFGFDTTGKKKQKWCVIANVRALTATWSYGAELLTSFPGRCPWREKHLRMD